MKKRIFSGVQSSGTPTLGNYMGAFKNWVDLQNTGEYDSLYCVVDLHAITIRRDPDELRRQSFEMYALLLAIGLDPKKNILFVQSHVPAHAELTWILNCYTMYGELSRMTQFKDKSARHPENINAGLFDYPVLMAADILLYDTNLVPVGGDQKQHVELTRDIATRFNGIYPGAFTLPEPYIPPVGGRIMSLSDPARKMDKSDPNPAARILLTEDDASILKKCKRAVTDSDGEIRYDPAAKPGVSNLLTLYSLCADRTMDEAVADFAGKGYGHLKTAAGEAVVAKLTPIREKTENFLQNPDYLQSLMRQGRDKALAAAAPVLNRVHDVLGLIAP